MAAMSDEDRHGVWIKSDQRYEDGCREDVPHPEFVPDESRLCALERQMREVRDALGMDDPNLTRDWVGHGRELGRDAQIDAWGRSVREQQAPVVRWWRRRKP